MVKASVVDVREQSCSSIYLSDIQLALFEEEADSLIRQGPNSDSIFYLVGVEGFYEVVIDYGTFAFYSAIKNIARNFNSIDPGSYMLPPSKTDKPTLVLDLDETLIHSKVETVEDLSSDNINAEDYDLKWDYFFELPSSNFEQERTFINVKKRKGVDEFLEILSLFYELVLWTAGDQAYADKIIDFLDPQNLIEHRLYRDHCTVLNVDSGVYIKNLRDLGRDLDRTLIVENSPRNFGLQIDNGIPITSFECFTLETSEGGSMQHVWDDNDRQLIILTRWLVEVQKDEHPVKAVSKWFNLGEKADDVLGPCKNV